jgi:hypothetical protein
MRTDGEQAGHIQERVRCSVLPYRSGKCSGLSRCADGDRTGTGLPPHSQYGANRHPAPAPRWEKIGCGRCLPGYGGRRAAIHAWRCGTRRSRGWWVFEIVIFPPQFVPVWERRTQYAARRLRDGIFASHGAYYWNIVATHLRENSTRKEKIAASCAYHDAQPPVRGIVFS